MSLKVDIKKKLGNFLLEVKFETKGETFAILGASGCGKSMTLKCIAGIETPDSGEIVLNDRVLFDSKRHINLKPQQRRVGYLFQDYALFPNMTVYENLKCSTKDKALIDELIKKFYLDGLEKLYPRNLSGGQKQRVAICRMLATKPDLLLFDEPFSALDNNLKNNLERELIELLDDFGGISILVSHDRNEVFRMTNEVAVMSMGKMLCVDEKHEFFEKPKSLAQTLLTGCKNVTRVRFLKMEAEKVWYEAIDWNTKLVLDKSFYADKTDDDLKKVSYIGLRAHYFKVVKDPGENVLQLNLIRDVEDIFSYTVFLHGENTPKTEHSLITFEVSKEEWMKIKKEQLLLHIPKDKMILIC